MTSSKLGLSVALLGALALVACQAQAPVAGSLALSEEEAFLANLKLPEQLVGSTVRVRLPQMQSAARTLSATTPTYVARIELSLIQAGQPTRSITIKRWWTKGGNPAIDFSNVPSGPTKVRAEAYDAAGNRLGETEQDVVLGTSGTQDLAITIPLGGVSDPFASDANQIETSLVQGNQMRGTALRVVQTNTTLSLGTVMYDSKGIAPDGSGGYFRQRSIHDTQSNTPQSLRFLTSHDGSAIQLEAGASQINNLGLGPNTAQCHPLYSASRHLLLTPVGRSLHEMPSGRRLATLPGSAPNGTTAQCFDDDGFAFSSSLTNVYRIQLEAPYAAASIATVANTYLASKPGAGFWSSTQSNLNHRGVAGDLMATHALPFAPRGLIADGQGGVWAWTPSVASVPTQPGRYAHLSSDGSVLADRSATSLTDLTVDTEGRPWRSGTSLVLMDQQGVTVEEHPFEARGVAPDGPTLWLNTPTGAAQIAI